MLSRCMVRGGAAAATPCQLSMENYCENWAQINGFGGGLGLDGGMAEYMVVPSARLLVALGDLSPASAAPLSDAALTPYHAIKRALPQLNAESTVVVLGVGGLGHMAIQLLRVLAPVRIIAADVDDKKLQQAKALGADDIVNNRNADEAADRMRKITGPRGAGLVLDCVGVQPTIDLGARLLGRNSVWTIVGLGGGHHDFHHGSTPYGTIDEHSVLGVSCRVDGGDCDGARRADPRRDHRVPAGAGRRRLSQTEGGPDRRPGGAGTWRGLLNLGPTSRRHPQTTALQVDPVGNRQTTDAG